jgi:hypothetical protein
MNARSCVMWLAAAAWALSGGAVWAAPEVVGKVYTPGHFDSLSFGGPVTVVFRQGDRDELFVEGNDGVQRQLTLTLRGTELVVRSETRFGLPWRGPERIRMQVVMRELVSLDVAGAADFVAPDPVRAKALRVNISGGGVTRFEKLKAERLQFTVSGAGDGHYTGSADELQVAVSGRGNFMGENLHSHRARVSINGIGKARVWVTDTLQASVTGIGKIDYWGQPKAEKSRAGIVSITPRGPKPAPQPQPQPVAAPLPGPVH